MFNFDWILLTVLGILCALLVCHSLRNASQGWVRTEMSNLVSQLNEREDTIPDLVSFEVKALTPGMTRKAFITPVYYRFFWVRHTDVTTWKLKFDINLESWLSGRKRRSWKPLRVIPPGVRIPSSPPYKKGPPNRAAFFIQSPIFSIIFPNRHD